jgi:serine/threonine-protein kinase
MEPGDGRGECEGTRSLVPGAHIGAYVVVEPLGAGSMGEVYRARDVRLDRQVALKVLPERFSASPGRLAALEHEARVLASLNDPHIAALYDVVRPVGMSPVLVLEFLSGMTLADRIAAEPGGLRMADALAIARQIAAALEGAHGQGIVHRDLKPSNVAITDEGVVKVLDFGLAKNLDLSTPADATDLMPSADPVRAAAPGTPAYMSPEQARGSRLDQRTDLWAFGCIVYEMLTGVRPFAGARASDVLASILDREADFGMLPNDTPPSMRRLLRRCLDKRPEFRLRHAGDAILEIDEADRERMAPDRRATVLHRRSGWRGATLALTSAGAATLVLWMAWPPAAGPLLTTLAITGEELERMTPDDADRFLAVARDGSAVAFPGNAGTQLFLRTLDSRRPEPLTPPGVGVRAPFFSPDGAWVGYVDGNRTVRKVARSGGVPTDIVTTDGPSRGASWAPDDTIVFATSHADTGLQRVGAGGGDVTVLTRADRRMGEADHIFPHVLPGGRAVLMTVLPVSRRAEEPWIALLDLNTLTWKRILDGGSDARYVTSGHLVYVARGELRAIAFDLDTLSTRGASAVVLPGVMVGHDLGNYFDVSVDGLLIYLDPARALAGRLLAWVDRDGREAILPLPPRPYAFPRIALDGSRAAVYLRDPEHDRDIALIDFRGHTVRRLTFGPELESWPLWLSSTRLAFSALKNGLPTLFVHPIDDRGDARQISWGARMVLPSGVAPDGSHLLASVEITDADRGWDVQAVPLPPGGAGGGEPQEPRVLAGLDSPFHERNGVISPGGQWVAYDSDAVGGRFEVFVRAYPETGGIRWQVSAEGGQQPRWSADGRELFFLGLQGSLMSAAVVDPEARDLSVRHVEALFDHGAYVISGGGNGTHQYDVGANGRFLMVRELGATTGALNQIIVVQNWRQELERLLPAP